MVCSVAKSNPTLMFCNLKNQHSPTIELCSGHLFFLAGKYYQAISIIESKSTTETVPTQYQFEVDKSFCKNIQGWTEVTSNFQSPSWTQGAPTYRRPTCTDPPQKMRNEKTKANNTKYHIWEHSPYYGCVHIWSEDKCDMKN